MTFVFVVMGGIALGVSIIAMLDSYARKRDRRSRPRVA